MAPAQWVRLTLAWLLATPSAAEAQGAGVATQLTRIAFIEDARGRHGTPASALLEFADSRNPVVRAAALRALGRQQSPALLSHIYPALRHPSENVRLAATDAAGQAAQGLRAAAVAVAEEAIAAVTDSLRASALGARRTPAAAGLAARTIGRLPYRDSASARRAESMMLAVARPSGRPAAWAAVSPPILEGTLHGLYALARQRRVLGAPSPEAIAAMRAAVAYRGAAGAKEAAARVRRLAMFGLTAAGAVDTLVVLGAARDEDEQVRRLAVVAQAGVPDSGMRRAVIRRALTDASPLVRHEAVRAARALAAADGCGPMLAAAGDANPHVALAAIDGLTAACRDRDEVAEALLGLVDANRSDSPVRAPGRSGWHVHAHALVALARTSPERAAGVVERDARESSLWTVRVYAARAARQLRDTATLTLLARDRDGNVRQEALGGLAATAGHAADALYLDALGAGQYHVVMEAAQALRGAPSPGSVVPALFQSLERITAERRETSRDARMALLDRLDELGTAGDADRLERFRTDYDSTVARRAAAIVGRWRGREVEAAPAMLPLREEEIRPLMSGTWRARVTMSATTGGGSFDIALLPREAPFTVARFVRLARSGYYNGLTFHRVEPGFVIQGGSPSANEYVGDGPFMRDELGPRSHTRGTLGISTRGRDTGDAQLFVNLIDNFRLDHDYTVFGEIVRGRDVAERVLEADVIERVDIVRVP